MVVCDACIRWLQAYHTCGCPHGRMAVVLSCVRHTMVCCMHAHTWCVAVVHHRARAGEISRQSCCELFVQLVVVLSQATPCGCDGDVWCGAGTVARRKHRAGGVMPSLELIGMPRTIAVLSALRGRLARRRLNVCAPPPLTLATTNVHAALATASANKSSTAHIGRGELAAPKRGHSCCD